MKEQSFYISQIQKLKDLIEKKFYSLKNTCHDLAFSLVCARTCICVRINSLSEETVLISKSQTWATLYKLVTAWNFLKCP